MSYYYFQEGNGEWYRLDLTTGAIEDKYGDDVKSCLAPTSSSYAPASSSYYYDYISHYYIVPQELRERLITTIERYKDNQIVIDGIYHEGHVLGCLEMLEILNPISISSDRLDEDKIAQYVSKDKNVPLAYVRACIAANKSLNLPDITAFQTLLEREGILEIEEIRERLLPVYYKLKVARGEALAAVRNVWHDLTKTMRKAEWYYEGNYKEGKE